MKQEPSEVPLERHGRNPRAFQAGEEVKRKACISDYLAFCADAARRIPPRGAMTAPADFDRITAVKHADRIYVLRDGQVIEQGGHADLIALGGQSAELFTLQASQYDL